MSDDRALIPRDAWPADFHPFGGTPKSPQEQAEWTRLWEEKQASRSAPLPDKPNTRTNKKIASNNAGSNVRQATRTTPGQTPALALETDILGAFLADLRHAGVAGEDQARKPALVPFRQPAKGEREHDRSEERRHDREA
jgi:hypothetical protein